MEKICQKLEVMDISVWPSFDMNFCNLQNKRSDNDFKYKSLWFLYIMNKYFNRMAWNE